MTDCASSEVGGDISDHSLSLKLVEARADTSQPGLDPRREAVFDYSVGGAVTVKRVTMRKPSLPGAGALSVVPSCERRSYPMADSSTTR